MSSQESATCPVCKSPAREAHDSAWPYHSWYLCQQCGRFCVTLEMKTTLLDDDDVRFKVSCLAAERRVQKKGPFLLCEAEEKPKPEGVWADYQLFEKDEMLAEFPKPVEILPRALRNLARRFDDHPFDSLIFSNEEICSLLFCSKVAQANRLWEDMDKHDLIRELSQDFDGGVEIGITSAGWDYVRELSKTAIDSQQGFVAMWFSPETDDFYKEGIRPAIEEAGYTARRIDTKEHLNKICDEIVAEIRQSKFVVADFTGQRGGVYFEAGFAMGLELPVIWLVHKDDVDTLHFDTRQYKHIVYSSPEDLKTYLRNSIVANIGRGPLTQVPRRQA